MNQVAVSYLASFERWVMLYGGDLPNVLNTDGDDESKPQPLPFAIHARFAPDPWGPWTDPKPILSTNAMARHLVCRPTGNPPPACRIRTRRSGPPASRRSTPVVRDGSTAPT